ncbi:MAG: hypothetical protein WBP40_05320 [Candidatus Moraniibacteriota bacterium]
MKNRKSIIAASILAIGTLTMPMAAQAQSAATATNTAGAAAQAAVNVNSPLTAPVSASGGSAGASITGVDLKTGDASAGVTVDFKPTSTTAMTFEASKIPLQSAGIPSATPGQAQLFFSNGATNPPTITGIALSRWARQTCNQVATRTHRGSSEVVKGSSGDTTIRATYYADFDKRFATDTTAPMVSFGLPGPNTPAVCLTVLTILGKNGTVDINTTDNDAEAFALAMSGFERIYIVSPESAIGGALGVESDGRGFGVGTSGVGLAGVVTAALGLSGGVNSGTTTPSTRIGSTYVILAKPQAHGASAVMSMSDFDAYHARMMAPTAPAGVGVREAAGARK